MEFLGQLINQCVLWRPFTYHIDEIIHDGRKTLMIRFNPIEPFEIDWVDAICNVEDGKLTMEYQDYRTYITFEKEFDYSQAKSKLEGHILIITIPSKARLISVSIHKDMTEHNNHNK